MAVKRKKDEVHVKILIVLFLSFFIGSVIFLIKFKSDARNSHGHNDVLLQINKIYKTEILNNQIIIHVPTEDKVNDVLNGVEKILTENDTTIKNYDLKRSVSSIGLTLFIQNKFDAADEFQIVILKKFEETGQSTMASLPAKAKICIIIDDAGYHNQITYQYIKLPIKMGIAVLPFLKNSQKIAGLIKNHKKEVLLHMPMEPNNYRNRNIRLFPKTLLCHMDTGQIHKLMDEMLNDLVYAVGINNHQGSRATADIQLMQAVLEKVKLNNLFFIDSLTSQKSVTEKIAKKLNVNFGKRNVFLDNRNDYAYIKSQMEQLIKIALKTGKAIGIGHIGNNNTYKVIKDYIPVFQVKQIELVYPSEIINKYYNKEVSKNVTENTITFH